MILLAVYVPESHLDVVKEAIFAAGGGHIGNYQCCCWQVKGEGQFMPGAESSPFIGSQNKIEKVSEYKVELVVTEDKIAPVVAAMKLAHPYEEPAYHAIQCLDV